MRWPHVWTCTRPGPGSQDPDTGEWVPGVDTIVYNDDADCQDGGREVARTDEGQLILRSPASLYLRAKGAAALHREGDVGVVTWEDGSQDDAEVALVDHFNNMLELRWLR